MAKEINVTGHKLVPEHTKLSDKEKQELLKKHNITVKELPLIKLDDPGIQGLNPQPGDVIKIRRHPDTPKESLFYRTVVE